MSEQQLLDSAVATAPRYSVFQEIVRPQAANPQPEPVPFQPRNRHHLLFPKKPWNSQLETKKLRQHPNLIVDMDEDIEAELHKQVTLVPLLGAAMARRVLRDFAGDPRSPLRSIHELMGRIDQAGRRPDVRDYERRLGDLTIRCLDLQREFLR